MNGPPEAGTAAEVAGRGPRPAQRAGEDDGAGAPGRRGEAAARLDELAGRFWRWRAGQQPRTYDDIPRLERPPGWLPDWRADTVRRYARELAAFAAECQALDSDTAPVAVRVGHRLLASAIARVHWELHLLRSWRRDPGFYVDQSIGVVVDLLLAPPPFTEGRRAAVIRALNACPDTLRVGLANVARSAVPEFARLAARRLDSVGDQVRATARALLAEVPGFEPDDLLGAADRAARALEEYRDWLDHRSAPGPHPAVGAEALRFFLSKVALLPYTAQELSDLGRREYERATVLESVSSRCLETMPRSDSEAAPNVFQADPYRGSAPHGGPSPYDRSSPRQILDRQIQQQQWDESRVRAFYADHALLTLPNWIGRYRMAAMPTYLAPLSWAVVVDDLTSPSQVGRDATSYAPVPAEGLPFFHRANSVDNRLGIVHEGCHFYQLSRSWRHPDPLRRHYYDSCPNEGIALYNEEMLLTAGLFDDSPPARTLLHTFMRLRALRVVIDVGLATGELDVDTASRMLATRGGVDEETARQEAAAFAAAPGQGLSYQTGKTQILRLLSDVRAHQGDTFDLRATHDYLWLNGNVPLSLLRWELLGRTDDLDRADALAPFDLADERAFPGGELC